MAHSMALHDMKHTCTASLKHTFLPVSYCSNKCAGLQRPITALEVALDGRLCRRLNLLLHALLAARRLLVSPPPPPLVSPSREP